MSSFDFDEPDHVAAGAVGVPGQRVFYLQARQGPELVSLRLEKQQVAALCEYLDGILHELEPVDDALPDHLDLIEPVVAEWVVGALAVAYERADDRILIVAEELDAESDREGADAPPAGEHELGRARFRMSRAQVAAMIHHARIVVDAGRPLCPVCQLPMDEGGHFCPRNN